MKQQIKYFLYSVIAFAVIPILGRAQLGGVAWFETVFRPLSGSDTLPYHTDDIRMIFIDALLTPLLGVFHLWPLAFPPSSLRSSLASLLVLAPVLFVDHTDEQSYFVAGLFAMLWIAIVIAHKVRTYKPFGKPYMGALLGASSALLVLISPFFVLFAFNALILAPILCGISLIWLIRVRLSQKKR